jgi:hypothetical protein
MKQPLIYFFSLLLVWSMVGCEGYLDINENPNRTDAAEPAFLFTNAITNYATNRSIDFGMAAAGWSQIQAPGTFGVFVNPARYNISVFTNGNTWDGMYANTLVNLYEAIRIAEANQPADVNAAAQAKIFAALTWWSLTVIWEDVPFDEALQPETFTLPNVNSQEEVFNRILALCDEAIAQIDPAAPLPGIQSNDLIYQGDLSLWVRLANSLKFRTLMTMVDADPSKAEQIRGMLANADMLSTPDDLARFPFFDDAGNRNPIYLILTSFTGGDNICYFGSEATINLMKDLNDPRLATYFVPGPSADTLEPVTAGGAGSIARSARMTSGTEAPAIIRPDQPELLFTYAEQMLLEAEAELRFNSDAATADEKMRTGISASLSYYAVSEEATAAYLASLPDLGTLTPALAREAISQQQWIDLIERPLEAWTQWRRTEIPALELPFNAPTTGIIRRLRYPTNEANVNTNLPPQKQLEDKMWFDL